ncbi:disulfide bond formation protein B [Aquisalimonas sp. APHAB1-3]|uniref:disulfide bond formation protein B n=2 Tax=unclassified Aquisalimonas TaxID=2644645 RepID=UPI0025BA1076|nr:disulfide bond formation protein B [Aquisalimonas sp.]
MRSMFATAETQMRQRQRWGHGTALILTLLILAAAYGLEYVGGMEPCPLCMVQRLVFAALAVVFLLGFLHGAPFWGRYFYGVLGALVAATGIGVASRHLWLQSLPPEEVPACGPGLDYMVDAFPITEVITMVLAGSGECAEVHEVFGLTLPGWTLAGYALLGLWALWICRRPR